LKEWTEGGASGNSCSGSVGIFYDGKLNVEIHYLEEGDRGYEDASAE